MRTSWDELIEQVGPRRAAREAWRACAFVVILSLALALAAHFIARAAHAQGLGFSKEECKTLAEFARTSAEIRDIGADVTKHLALVRERLAARGVKLSPIVRQELMRVYAEHLVPERAEASAYMRCITGEILRREG